ncbi:short-chain dehydrogenase [Pollutimonas subterranea]|uniref:Short-chain dehydrogenase n=1 Tax=Pollutimonas subterranea TaxID=2045210 RepID=A0A2N4TZP8_9BURK|nr:SDR family oxidoreductase [Pollutimonas subterranea]PLC48231.1 short-chain dehydrogenase [Pollutimonas subterranea]
MQSLARSCIVLTGASSGIGLATALGFAREGAHLVLAARDPRSLASVAAACERLGGQALAVPTDVTDPAAVQELAQTAIRHFGRIDIWINNVGTGAVGRFEAVPMESHRRVIEATLLGHLHGAHAVLPHFRARGRGTLINMISIGGWVPSPYGASYAASKFGLRGFSESLRAEVSDAPGIHVCDVYPTFVDTPGMSHGANYTGKSIKPVPPMLDPREVAARIVALAKAPRASISIGSVAWPARIAHAIAPDLNGRMTRRLIDQAFKHANPAAISDGNLFDPSEGHAIDGGFRKDMKPPISAPIAVAAGIATLGLWLAYRLKDHRRRID